MGTGGGRVGSRMDKPKKQKVKVIPKLRASGSVSISNLNSKKSQCKTLTYTIKNCGTLENVRQIAKELDKRSSLDNDGSVEVNIGFFGTKEQTIDMSYKVKNCSEGEQEIAEVKEELDTYLKQKGGQTTLDETQ